MLSRRTHIDPRVSGQTASNNDKQRQNLLKAIRLQIIRTGVKKPIPNYETKDGRADLQIAIGKTILKAISSCGSAIRMTNDYQICLITNGLGVGINDDQLHRLVFDTCVLYKINPENLVKDNLFLPGVIVAMFADRFLFASYLINPKRKVRNKVVQGLLKDITPVDYANKVEAGGVTVKYLRILTSESIKAVTHAHDIACYCHKGTQRFLKSVIGKQQAERRTVTRKGVKSEKGVC